MKHFAIAVLLVLVALSGVGAAWAFNDDSPLTGPDSIQAPQPRTGRGHASDFGVMPMKQKLSVLSGIHVLVVDDYDDTRDVMKCALEYFGALVSLASSAREGLWKLQQITPNVILADLAMPIEDGQWFIKEVRKRDAKSGGQVPTIALTAHGKAYERTALAAGFDHFMEKPVELDQLCIIIEKLTTAKRTARAS